MPNIAQNNTQYVTDGLTIASNDSNIITRDGRGNITLTSGSVTNQTVIIENNYDSFTNRSVANTIDTTFNYFKFPPTRFFPDASIDPSIFDELDPTGDTVDQLLTTRYTLPYIGNDDGFDSELFRVNTSYPSSWYTNGGAVVEGTRRIPFVGPNQIEEGAYIFTPDIIKLLKESGKTIKFDIQCAYLVDDIPNNPGVYPDTGIIIRLNRDTPTVFRSDILNSTFYLLSPGPDPKFPYIRFQYVVDIENDTFDYDKFKIDTVAGNPSWLSIANSYWNINLIEIGSEPIGFNYNNVQGQPSTQIYINNINGQQLVP